MQTRKLEKLKHEVETHSHSLGFDMCRIVLPDMPARARRGLYEAIGKNHHGTMEWMSRRLSARARPAVLWPDVQAIIVLAISYTPAFDALRGLRIPQHGNISVYAQNRDYHGVIKGRLKMLAQFMGRRARQMGLDECAAKVFVDTAPVLEKPLAARAGIGWQGKHTNLVSRRLGSWFFLGEIFTSLPLPPDSASQDRCGSCRACLDICPTNAFPRPYQLDARRCISYLTIEHKGPIPHEFRAAIGNRIYGCDDCLAVCPWNKFAQKAREYRLIAPPGQAPPGSCASRNCLARLARLSAAGFRRRFQGSPVRRIGHARFLRNVIIAIGNSQGRTHLMLLQSLVRHRDPLIRGAAIWALARIGGPACLAAARRRYAPGERNADVAREWQYFDTGQGRKNFIKPLYNNNLKAKSIKRNQVFPGNRPLC